MGLFNRDRKVRGIVEQMMRDVVVKKRIRLSHIHNDEKRGFDTDLCAIDLLYFDRDGEVEFAARLFSIKPPQWLYRRIFPERTHWISA